MGQHNGHSHHHDVEELTESFDPALRRRLNLLAAFFAVATLVGVALIWPGPVKRSDTGSLGVPTAWYNATVTRVHPFTCPGEETLAGDDQADAPPGSETESNREQPFAGTAGLCIDVSFRLARGPDAGEIKTIQLFDVGSLPEFSKGSGIVVSYLPDALPEFRYQLADRQRVLPMVLLGLIFAVLVIVQGRLRGFAALAGLIASIGVIVVLVLPALVAGTSPVLVAVVASSLIAYLALYLAHGVNPLTTVALLGTLGALSLVVLLSWAFTGLTTLSGLVTEDAQYVRAFGGNLNFSGLVLAGIILGALGAIDDMTVTQASAVAELKSADPTIGYRDLYRGAIRIGRDHVASTVNTLALAYAGASLPLLLLFVESNQTLGRVLTSEVVATELVRTLVGSIGLVAAVPITTMLAARLVAARRSPSPDASENLVTDQGLATDDGLSGNDSLAADEVGPDEHTETDPSATEHTDEDWDTYLRRSSGED